MRRKETLNGYNKKKTYLLGLLSQKRHPRKITIIINKRKPAHSGLFYALNLKHALKTTHTALTDALTSPTLSRYFYTSPLKMALFFLPVFGTD